MSSVELENLKRTIDEEINNHNDEYLGLYRGDEYLGLYRGDDWKEKVKFKMAMKDNCTLMVYTRPDSPLDTPIKILERVVIQTEWARWYERTIRKAYNVITKIEYNKLSGKGVDNATNILH